MDRIHEIIKMTDEEQKIKELSVVLARALTDYDSLGLERRAVARMCSEMMLQELKKKLP